MQPHYVDILDQEILRIFMLRLYILLYLYSAFMIFISINKSIGYIQRATEEGSMVKTYNVQCSMALFINATLVFLSKMCNKMGKY